ncbi:hypothetical protein B566_EDAN013129 [Ephemera danica]|nr:hypothetical protein B566_EDAN013129 [Ephemera danica]
MANPPRSFGPTDGLAFDFNVNFIKQQFLDRLSLKFGPRFDAIFKEFTKATTMENKMKAAGKYYSLYGRDNPYERDYQKVKDTTNFKCKLDSEKFRKEGNETYQKTEMKKAHELYTKSISYAPVDSAELALAYANRSAVLRSMKKCRECLMDIERALSHGYPKKKSFKLLLREMQCHGDMGNMVLVQTCTEEVIFPTEVPELSYGANSEIVGASSAVKLEYNEQQGRHLVMCC